MRFIIIMSALQLSLEIQSSVYVVFMFIYLSTAKGEIEIVFDPSMDSDDSICFNQLQAA